MLYVSVLRRWKAKYAGLEVNEDWLHKLMLQSQILCRQGV
jgi:hypothetical protein